MSCFQFPVLWSYKNNWPSHYSWPRLSPLHSINHDSPPPTRRSTLLPLVAGRSGDDAASAPVSSVLELTMNRRQLTAIGLWAVCSIQYGCVSTTDSGAFLSAVRSYPIGPGQFIVTCVDSPAYCRMNQTSYVLSDLTLPAIQPIPRTLAA